MKVKVSEAKGRVLDYLLKQWVGLFTVVRQEGG
jgi:hypothetical protein